MATVHVAFISGVVNPQRWSSDLRLVLPRLDVGVPIFFVLSGLLIARPFVVALARSTPGPSLGTYAARRLVRVYPLYWLVLAATLGFASRHEVLPSASELVRYATLTHIYRPSTAIGPITQSWSLATELSFYAFLPLWFWLCGRVLQRYQVEDPKRRLRFMLWSLLAWVGIAYAWRAGVVANTAPFPLGVTGAVDTRGAYLTWLPNYLDTFAVGVALAILAERGQGRLRLGRAFRCGCYVLAAGALWIASAHIGLPPLHTGFTGVQTFQRHFLFVLCAAGVVAPSVLCVRSAVRRQSQLQLRVARIASAGALGSYGIYLWHQFVTTRWFDRPEHPVFNTPFLTTWIVVICGSGALAFLSYWAVERWPRKLMDRVRDVAKSVPRQLSQSPALDGLRGIAILAVLGNHLVFLDPKSQRWFLQGGFLGVDVFLVLSGFLICATLLAEFDRTSTINLGSFLRRRARRLLPPLVIFFVFHAIVVLAIGDSFTEELRQAAASLTFVSNWQLTFGHHPPFDLVHLWSLAFEGQMYVLCGVAMFSARKYLNRLPSVLAALSVASVAVALWRLVELRWGADLEALYVRTDVRTDAILIGALGAFLWRSGAVSQRVAARLGAGCGLAIVASWWMFAPGNHALFAGGFTLIAMAAVAVILAAVDSAPNAVQSIAGWPPFRTIGRMSYSVYLWHLPVYIWTTRSLPSAPTLVRIPLALGATFGISVLSHRLIERRYHAWKARTQGTRD